MANTKMCVKKDCEECGIETRGMWRFRNHFYCFNCYQKVIKSYHAKNGIWVEI